MYLHGTSQYNIYMLTLFHIFNFFMSFDYVYAKWNLQHHLSIPKLYIYTNIHYFYEFYFMTPIFWIHICQFIFHYFFLLFILFLFEDLKHTYLKATYDWYVICLLKEQESSSK